MQNVHKRSDFEYPGKDLEAMSFAPNYHRWILSEFSSFLTGDIAEIGAGTGNFSKLLLGASNLKTLAAYEPSTEMFNKLVSSVGHDIRFTGVNDFFRRDPALPPQRFDGVAYVNVLEHVDDDIGQLALVYESLRLGGAFLCFVPALPWLYSDLDKDVGHVRRYTKKELVTKVKLAGFHVARVKYFDSLGIIPWYVAFVLMKKRTTASNVSMYDRLVVPWLRAVERTLSPPIGKNLLLIAKKV